MAMAEMFMSGKRYTDEFKIDAVRQVTERDYSVVDMASRLGITTRSLYAWIRAFDKASAVQRAKLDQNAEVPGALPS